MEWILTLRIARKMKFRLASFLTSTCGHRRVSCVFLAFVFPMLSDCAVYVSRSMGIVDCKVALRALDDTLLVGKMSDV